MQQIKEMLKDVFFNRFMLEDFAWYALASIVLCAICCILLLFFAGRRKKILCCLLTEYIFLVLCFTVICHKKEELDQLLPISFNDYSHWGIGALAGGVGVGVGAGISSSLAGGSFGAGFLGSKAAMSSASCFISGTAIGGGAGFSGGFITGLGNGFMNKESFKDALWNGTKSGLIGGLSGAFLGGALGGIDAYLNDRNFWNGKLPQSNNALENEIWGEISIKARGTGPGSSSLDGHSWIELTDSKGETTSFGTWGNQGEQEFFINFENDLGSHYDAIQTKTITNAQRLRFDKFINSFTKNQKWSIFRNCSYFSSKAFYYTTGENVMAHPFGIPIYTPSWLTRTITH